MAACGRRSRAKLLFCLVGVTLLGYLLFFRHPSGEVAAANRRDVPADGGLEDERLRRPVYEKPPLDPNAPGEMGRAVKLNLNKEERMKEEESIQKHQINTYVSDRISLHRRLPERWNPLCSHLKYDYKSLPTTSVVIAFYNEAWSTLLRTVHSVLETSPDILLSELVLVDDYSDRDHLKEPLEKYLSGLRKVRLIRATKREGLVRARLLGASIATGDVLTFLDCHCECHEGWLEPLLKRIKEEPTAVVCPIIDVIDWNTFQYLGNAGEPQIGGFDWRLVFTWHSVPEYEQKRRHSPTDVIRSPTMAGGLFSVSKSYFHYLGTYDTGMEVWGGENLEFSFRIWQCGGSLEIHPCSHVGHVFPKSAPYSRSKALANSVRAAEVWMDEYKDLYYHRNPHARRVSPHRKLSKHRSGGLKSRGKANHCFDYNPGDEQAIEGHRVILYPCHGMGQNQFFEYSVDGEICYNTREPAGCVVGDNISTYLTVQRCKKQGQAVPLDQKFVLRKDGSLFHVSSQKCVEAVDQTDNGTPAPALQPCSDKPRQKWFFEEKL
uniref:Polypeptide N-acetylgalactosaminyltransferase n=1 Tax=Fundulus heteroclitus TaxID=8078 RepID=A0A3Q2NMG0_FUNHE